MILEHARPILDYLAGAWSVPLTDEQTKAWLADLTSPTAKITYEEAMSWLESRHIEKPKFRPNPGDLVKGVMEIRRSISRRRELESGRGQGALPSGGRPRSSDEAREKWGPIIRESIAQGSAQYEEERRQRLAARKVTQ